MPLLLHFGCASNLLIAFTLSFFFPFLLFKQRRQSVSSVVSSRGVDDDTVSLFVFGLDEDKLADEASKNNGVVSYDYLTKEHYAKEDISVRDFGLFDCMIYLSLLPAIEFLFTALMYLLQYPLLFANSGFPFAI